MLSFSKALYCALFMISVGVKARPGINADVTLDGYEPAPRSKSKVAAAYYTGYHADAGFPLSKVSWSKYTDLIYSFAVTTPDLHNVTLNGSNPDLLPVFVSEAKKNGVKALVAVGGWTGSRWFSSNVGTPQNRTQFVKTLIDFARKYKLDGLDFDWEYPALQGIGCNTISASDTANFLSLLQLLRQDPLGAKLTLSASVSINPFAGPDGKPMADVSEFASVLDRIAVMNYDIWGPWSSTVGPNAPLNDSCEIPSNQFGSAVSAVDKWHAAGIPKNQILLAMPAYGHSFRVRRADAFVDGTSTLASHPKFNATDRPVGDSWDDPAGVDECGNPQLPGGIMNFWALVGENYLTQQGAPAYGVPYRYDECSQTPYVYNFTTEVMISFDNAQSYAAKGKFVTETGLGGFSIWEAGGDYHDILLDSVRTAAGFNY